MTDCENLKPSSHRVTWSVLFRTSSCSTERLILGTIAVNEGAAMTVTSDGGPMVIAAYYPAINWIPPWITVARRCTNFLTKYHSLLVRSRVARKTDEKRWSLRKAMDQITVARKGTYRKRHPYMSPYVSLVNLRRLPKERRCKPILDVASPSPQRLALFFLLVFEI